MTDRRKDLNNQKWVNTKVEYVWSEVEQDYIEINREGYFYDGPWALAHDVAPIWEAPDYRWVNDNGTHPTDSTGGSGGEATFAAAENTAISAIRGSEYRLRLGVGESNSAAGTGLHTGSWTLQFENNTQNPGTWTTLGAATDVYYYDSTHLTNGTAS